MISKEDKIKLTKEEVYSKLLEYNINVSDNTSTYYKYMTIETAIAVLESQTMRFSSPKRFNDPFELALGLRNPKIIQNERLFENLTLKLIESNAEYADQKSFVKKVIKTHLQNVRNHHNEVYEELVDHLRLLCLSETYESVLMWSHYANNHTGLCIGIKPNKFHLPFSYQFMKVNYVSEFKSINEIEYGIDEGVAMTYWVFTKSDNWKYEKECRIHTIISPKKVLFKRLIGDKRMHDDFKFHKNSICEIYFGVNTKHSDIKRIEKILIEKKYMVAIIKKAIVVDGTFALAFDTL